MNEYITKEDATIYTVLLVVQTTKPAENHRPVASH